MEQKNVLVFFQKTSPAPSSETVDASKSPSKLASESSTAAPSPFSPSEGARQVVKTTALYERTSSPWFKPHKLHFFVESDKSLFWDEGYLYSCVLSAIVTNSAMLWAYIQRENTVCLWCWVRFPLYLDRVVCTYMLGAQIPRSNLACIFDHEIFAWENHPTLGFRLLLLIYKQVYCK